MIVKRCGQCDGRGWIGWFWSKRTCPKCNGTGDFDPGPRPKMTPKPQNLRRNLKLDLTVRLDSNSENTQLGEK